MKKIFAALLVGLMTVSVAACSNNNTVNAPSGQQSSVVSEESKLAEIVKTDSTKDDYLMDTKLYRCFYEKVSGDNAHIEISGDVEINGSTMSVDVEMQKQGDNSYSSAKMMGMSMLKIQKDGYEYNFNPMSKTYTKTEIEKDDESSDDMGGITSAISSIKDTKFIENGLSDEEGTTDYEKYSSSGTIVTIYFNGDEVKYMDIEPNTETQEASQTSASESKPESGSSVVDSQKMRLNISVTDEIDEKLFEIPDGYTLQEESKIEDNVGSDMNNTLDDFSIADAPSESYAPSES